MIAIRWVLDSLVALAIAFRSRRSWRAPTWRTVAPWLHDNRSGVYTGAPFFFFGGVVTLEPNSDLGIVRRIDGGFEARLVRQLEHDPQAVWAMLTEPGRLVEWLAPGMIELRVGGKARLDFIDSGTVIDSAVSAIEAPRLIEYSWSSPGEPLRPVRFDVAPDAAGTRLTLTLRIPAGEEIARSCAGWEAHLQMLLAALEGVPIKFPFERFKATRSRYSEMVASLR